MALRRAATAFAQRAAGWVPAEAAAVNGEAAEVYLSGPSFQSVRHASNQAVKQRIRAIKNIGKITKAMKMVAASKMRNAQVAVEESRGIVSPFIRLFGEHPAVETDKNLTVAVTSDRGLCGGLNSNITKYTKTLLAIYGKGDPKNKQLATIGDKGRSQLSRIEADRFVLNVNETYKVKVTFPQASLLAEELLKTNPETIRVIYNKFKSAISYKPTIATVLSAEAMERQLTQASGNKLDAYEMEVLNERADVLKDLAEFQLAVTLYNGMLENNCSEHASRMAAMENSTKSASEMLGRLTLDYNRKRQATITTELIEIIAGASALMDS